MTANLTSLTVTDNIHPLATAVIEVLEGGGQGHAVRGPGADNRSPLHVVAVSHDNYIVARNIIALLEASIPAGRLDLSAHVEALSEANSNLWADLGDLKQQLAEERASWREERKVLEKKIADLNQLLASK